MLCTTGHAGSCSIHPRCGGGCKRPVWGQSSHSQTRHSSSPSLSPLQPPGSWCSEGFASSWSAAFTSKHPHLQTERCRAFPGRRAGSRCVPRVSSGPAEAFGKCVFRRHCCSVTARPCAAQPGRPSKQGFFFMEKLPSLDQTLFFLKLLKFWEAFKAFVTLSKTALESAIQNHSESMFKAIFFIIILQGRGGGS